MKYIITFAFGFYMGRRFYQNQQIFQNNKAVEKVGNLFKKVDSPSVTKQ